MKAWVVAATITTLLSCTAAAAQPPKVADPEDRIERLLDATAALVRVDPNNDSRHVSFCAGVWIAPRVLLTAAHCVGVPWPLEIAIHGYSGVHPAHKLKVDPHADLATVALDDGAVALATAQPAFTPPAVGAGLDIVGHPLGHEWSWVPGFVSADRWIDQGQLFGESETEATEWTQVAAPIARGNSGGPAFNRQGNLVGICSFTAVDYPGAGFFVSLNEIRRFLSAE